MLSAEGKGILFNLRRVIRYLVRELRRTRCTRQAEEKESGARDVRHGKPKARRTEKKGGPHDSRHTGETTPDPPHNPTLKPPIIKPQTCPICSGHSPHVGATSDV